ncbi:MAG TPA: 16S rRNA (cytosine(1402)-N(4))-methyltransferase RsmH [Gemmatimonadaceae bacterium]|nr:16S rRNA (cytosine(1402)-N(4))-methyltransferase RsmH [Gemmatimonadaceae bacterium]
MPQSQVIASDYHDPVMVEQVASRLGSAAHVLDGTLGGGGHTRALLERGVRVTAVDRDPAAIAEVRATLSEFIASGRLQIFATNYAELASVPELSDVTFDGILLDLGVSSRQLDEASRGFTFRPGAELDMRMDPGTAESAAGLLARASAVELAWIFREYADERRAMRLAKEVVRRRANAPMLTSDDLVGAIRGALGPETGPADFARLFQALRIAVNDELRGLARALPDLRDRLEPQGTFVVIAYHSGEDRIVKDAWREWTAECICPPRQPICTCRGAALGETLTRKPLLASDAEVARNPRARSARLRAWRRA